MRADKIEIPKLSETLFIPLAARANESKRSDGVLRDNKAIEFLDRVDTTSFVVDGGNISTHGILARTKIIDEEIRKLVSDDRNNIIINLGAGLDTRYDRLSDLRIQWYDVDLPQVIELRKKFVQENASIHFIEKSVLDESWIEEIKVCFEDRVIIIAEGLLMYFTEEDTRKIFTMLSGAFPYAHMFFDVVHSFFVNKGISSEFLWGIDTATEIERMNENIRLVQAWSMGDLLKERQSWVMRILNIFPSTGNRSQILHCRCIEEDEERNAEV